MEEEFGPDLITLTDENGEEFELEVLCSIEYKDHEYLALIDSSTPDDAENIEVTLLRVEDEDGLMVAIEDEAEMEAVYNIMMEQMYAEDGEDGEA